MRRLVASLVMGVMASSCALFTSLDGLAGDDPADVDASGRDAADGDAALDVGIAADAASAVDYRALVLADDPVAYYRLADTAGAPAKDETGRFDGITVGNLVYGQPGPFGGESKSTRFAKGLIMADSLARSHAWPAMTIEAWASSEVPAGNDGFIATFAEGTGGDLVSLFHDGPTRGYAMTLDDAARIVSAPAVTDGEWHHVAVTIGGGQVNLYVDGVVRASGAGTLPAFAGDGYFVIGADYDSVDGAPLPNEYFAGRLAELALYDRVLPAERIAAHSAARP